jgi:UDP-2,3-diacylglucosamine hydrolase
MKAVITSDLHLFSQRTLAGDFVEEFRRRCRMADAIVLVGDIFDFRWSVHGSVAESLPHASAWLAELCSANHDAAVYYIVGNHDCVPEFTTSLEQLADRRPCFHWKADWLRLGSTAFLHGDIAHPGLRTDGLLDYRRQFTHHRPRGAWMNRLYKLAVASRAHVIGANILYRTNPVLRRIERYLTANDPSAASIREVYFGHTHRRLRGFEYGGRIYYNGGAPMPGMEFEILEAEIDE